MVDVVCFGSTGLPVSRCSGFMHITGMFMMGASSGLLLACCLPSAPFLLLIPLMVPSFMFFTYVPLCLMTVFLVPHCNLPGTAISQDDQSLTISVSMTLSESCRVHVYALDKIQIRSLFSRGFPWFWVPFLFGSCRIDVTPFSHTSSNPPVLTRLTMLSICVATAVGGFSFARIVSVLLNEGASQPSLPVLRRETTDTVVALFQSWRVSGCCLGNKVHRRE
jgi:hypothetical protein